MDPLDIVSKGIRKITSAYGKKVQKTKTAPAIEKNAPVEIKGDKYRLGFARAEIMPDLTKGKTYYIAGHGSGHVMEGVLTPVYVHALWLDCGNDEGILWLSADIVGLTGVEVRKIRERVFASKVIKGCKAVNFTSTHSHSGIDTVGYWGKPFLSIPADGKDPEYMEQLFAKSVKVCEEAYLNRKAGILFRALQPIPDGLFSKRRFPDRHEILTRIRFAPDDGGNETWIVNVGAHPNSLGGANRMLSGEYPYFLRENVKEKCGADVFFGCGALGGMDAAKLDENDPFNCVKLQGKMYAEAACAIESDEELEPVIKFIQRKFYLPVCNNVLTLLAMKGTMSFEAFPCKTSDTGIAMLSELTYMTFGKQKIAFLPGENFVYTVYGGYLTSENSSTGKGGEVNPAPLAEIAGDSSMVVFSNTNDMTGYVVAPNDWVLNPTQPYLNGTRDRFNENHYHETNSMGPETQKTIADAFAEMVKDFG